MTTLDQLITLRRPANLTIDEFNMMDAEFIFSIPSRENRVKALNQIHPSRQDDAKALVVELFNRSKRNA